jgi:hypothetical protein
MLLVIVFTALAALGGQDPGAPGSPALQLPRSRHAVVPREPVEAEDVLEVDADGAFRVDGKRFVGAAVSDRHALESLEAWLASIARGMPDDPLDTRSYRDPATGERLEILHLGSLRVRADRNAPWSRVRLVLAGCTDEHVGIPRIDFAVRDARAPAQSGWLSYRPPDLDASALFTDDPEDRPIGFLDHVAPSVTYVGPVLRVEVRLRALRDERTGERRLRYMLGPRTYDALEPMRRHATALLLEDPERVWTITTEGDLRWHEVLALLDLLRDTGVSRPTFVLPAEALR